MEIYRVFVGVATNVQVLHNRARLFSIAGLPDAGAHLPATHARDGPEGRTPDDGRATPADIRGDGDHCRAGAHRATLAPDAVEPETASDPGAPALSDATPDVGAQPSCCTHRLAPRHPRRLKLQRGGYGIRGKREELFPLACPLFRTPLMRGSNACPIYPVKGWTGYLQCVGCPIAASRKPQIEGGGIWGLRFGLVCPRCAGVLSAIPRQNVPPRDPGRHPRRFVRRLFVFCLSEEWTH